KRAHWHVMFSARSSSDDGVSCRSIHRTLYGFYGTDIRTCIERIKDCQKDGFIKVVDASGQPCAPSPGCFIAATGKLYESFDRHCRDTIGAVCEIFGDSARRRRPALDCDGTAISAIFDFFNGYDQKWRQTCEALGRQKGLTPAHLNDA